MYFKSNTCVLNKLQLHCLELHEGAWAGVTAVGSIRSEASLVPDAAGSPLWTQALMLAVPSAAAHGTKTRSTPPISNLRTIPRPSAVPRPSCRTRGPAEPGMEFSERIRLPRAAAEKSRPGVITPRVPHPSELDNPFPRHPVGARDRSQPGVPLPGACACDSPPRTVDPSSALEVPARACKGPEACLTLYRCACRGSSGGRAFRGRYQC